MSTPPRVRPPPMATLEAFVAAVRVGSFSGAATGLNLTPGAVSRQMAVLEADLGVPLFVRDSRGVHPTAAGRRLFDEVEKALSLVLRATEEARLEGSPGEEIRISVSPSFGARWLLPRLARFQAEHPALRVVPVADNRLVDLEREGFDFAVRYTASPSSDLMTVRFLEEELSAVISPRLLQGEEAPSLQMLERIPLLHDTSQEGWLTWLTAIGRPDLLQRQGTVYNDYNLTLEAAAAGLGIAMGRTALIDADLRAGRLVELLPFRVPNPRAYYLVRSQRAARWASQVLWEWLASSPPALPGQ